MTDDDEDEYIPPPLPDWPVLTPPALLGLILVVLALVLLLFPGLLDLASDTGEIWGGLALIAAGLLFISRLKNGRSDDDSDHGAVL